ncbi:hypothetical protein CCM_09033 [Cordyceps militaris CM01]|uniref:Uncharacterized protein n=1 Tax=Cordyceps militaris (strain CM01) TaxID=983644 RepID=G3JSZ0_CORMM|nr:uncharacterized protein CCM_09033 [Cordyceps militaris CM01]EGX88986.1 hypothetical protein CCM_09033 [Cordyceps militaris CM01]
MDTEATCRLIESSGGPKTGKLGRDSDPNAILHDDQISTLVLLDDRELTVVNVLALTPMIGTRPANHPSSHILFSSTVHMYNAMINSTADFDHLPASFNNAHVAFVYCVKVPTNITGAFSFGTGKHDRSKPCQSTPTPTSAHALHPARNRMQDALRPNDETFKRVYATGYQTWIELYHRAIDSPLEFPSSNMANAFPSHPRIIPQLELDRRSTCVLHAIGRTVWETADKNCDLPSLTMKTALQVTATCATRVHLEDSCQTTPWNQFGEHGDHIPILTLAWAYVLSARWAEIIPGATMEYTNSRAPLFPTCESIRCDSTPVQLGDMTDHALRWWEAVLATDEGWDASILHNTQNLKSPWSVSLQMPGMSIHLKSKPATLHNHAPASYATASSYILAYVAYHGIYDQSCAAFATALLLPTRHRISKSVHWARPHFPAKHGVPPMKSHGQPPWGRDKQQLDKLLTMSCNTIGMQSILNSSFIEPDLPCNICGAWLQGTFAVLDAPSAQKPAVLAHMLMQKSPHLDFLWLGAILLDVHPYIMRWARPAAWLIDLQAAAWTGTFVSFIQKPVSVEHSKGEITRADEARLMFLAQSEYHCSPPLVPFSPFGFIALKDCILDVQLHACCAGEHGLRYTGISWDCMDKTTIFQKGAADSWTNTKPLMKIAGGEGTVPYEKLDRDGDCSESMTRSMFTWLRDADGYPVAEKAIREHEWIADESSSDEEGDIAEGDGGSHGPAAPKAPMSQRKALVADRCGFRIDEVGEVACVR